MGPSQVASTGGGDSIRIIEPFSKHRFNNMEIAEFVPLSQKTKKSVKAKKKALASIEETKRKEKEKRVSKERGKLFEQISLRTGHPIDKVYRSTYFGCQHSF